MEQMERAALQSAIMGKSPLRPHHYDECGETEQQFWDGLEGQQWLIQDKVLCIHAERRDAASWKVVKSVLALICAAAIVLFIESLSVAIHG